MDALRKTLVCLAVVIMLVCTVPAVADGDSYATDGADGVLLYEVSPRGDVEGVSIYNYGNSTVNLKGYSFTDGLSGREGTVTINSDIRLASGEFVVFADKDDIDNYFINDRNVILYGKDSAQATEDGSFNLADSGDQVYLKDPSGKVIDAVYYGSSDTDEEYWFGPTVSLNGNYYIQRTTGQDTDSADDWFSHIPGRTDYAFDPNMRFDATVTPFLFPDSGGIPIFDAISQAQESVYICIYIMENTNMYALLQDLLEKGVEVTILIEGSPVGGMTSSEQEKLNTISDCGADVRIINYSGADSGRYNYVHAKYAVIDGETVVLTSENWTQDNLNGSLTASNEIYSGDNGNRGWGAVVESRPYAELMLDIFMNDFSTEYGDVIDFDEKYPEANTYTLGDYKPVESASFPSYQAEVTPVMSPDSSADAIEYYISEADERVYVEQQSFTYDIMADDSPIRYMSLRAAAGVECRFILSGGISTDDPEKVVQEINSSTQISAATMDKPYVHNKGIISDDVAIVNSINWTSSSIDMNRESGVAIYSADIADYFADAFDRDFVLNYTYDGFSVDITSIATSYEPGKETTFQVVVTPSDDTYTFHWDFGDGQTRDTTVPRVVYTPTDGAHELTITVSNSEGKTTTVSQDYYVGEAAQSGSDDGEGGQSFDDISEQLGDWWYIIAPVIVIIAAIAGAVKKLR